MIILLTSPCFSLLVLCLRGKLITRKLYNLGSKNILQWCVLDHEWPEILWEFHCGVVGGHVEGKEIDQKILQEGLWWFNIFKYAKDYARACDVYKRVGKPSCREELPLHPILALQAFEKWEIDSIGPINPIAKHLKARYNITSTNYLTYWAEVELV